VTPTRRAALTVADMRMEMVARAAAVAALAVVAASFAYSFAQIKWVSDHLGATPAGLSYAFPLIIDLPALVASALTVALASQPFRQRAYAWTVLIVFTSLSWLCNGLHAVTHSTIGDAVAGVWGTVLVVFIAGFPPIGIVLGVHLWAFALRHSAAADMRAPGKTVPARPRTQTTPAPARAAAQPMRAARASSSEQDRARAAFDAALEANPDERPVAAQIHRDANVSADMATTRRWVQKWWDERSNGHAPVRLADLDPARSA
jgi:hypothetical protein